MDPLSIAGIVAAVMSGVSALTKKEKPDPVGGPAPKSLAGIGQIAEPNMALTVQTPQQISPDFQNNFQIPEVPPFDRQQVEFLRLLQRGS